jgi:hypothetical protein
MKPGSSFVAQNLQCLRRCHQLLSQPLSEESYLLWGLLVWLFTVYGSKHHDDLQKRERERERERVTQGRRRCCVANGMKDKTCPSLLIRCERDEAKMDTQGKPSK